MTLEEALELLRRDPGHEEAWENFYRQMYRPLLTYVRSLLLNFSLAPGDDAHDVVHDSLTAFWQRWGYIGKGITTVAAADSYLRKSCRNLLVLGVLGGRGGLIPNIWINPSVSDIARVLRVPFGTAKAQLARARGTLLKTMRTVLHLHPTERKSSSLTIRAGQSLL